MQESRSIIALRAGSDNAANVVPNLSTTIWLWNIWLMSSVNFAILDFHSLISGTITPTRDRSVNALTEQDG